MRRGGADVIRQAGVAGLLSVGLGAAAVGCGSTTEPEGVVALEVFPDSIYLTRGDSVQLQVAALDSLDRAVPGVLIRFDSSDPAVVTVSGLGTVRSVGPTGSATVTVSGGGRSLEIPVWVFRHPAVIDLSPEDTTITAGDGYRLRVMVVDSVDDPLPLQLIVLASNDTTVATVSPQGFVTSLGPTGEALILGARGSIFDVSRVQVAAPGGVPAGAAGAGP
jgi:uncharacterized protein YjdB